MRLGRVGTVPDSAGLEVGRGTREDSSGQSVTRLTAIHDTLGNRRK